MEYQIKRYERDPKTDLAPKSLKAVHPLGKSPVITDGEVTVAESGAIIEYLLDTYGPDFIPEKGSSAYRAYQYWLHFSEGSLMPPLLLNLVFHKIRNSRMPFIAKPVARGIANKVMEMFVTPNIELTLGYIDDHLAKHKWFAGDALTGADFQMSFPLEGSKAAGLVTKEHSHINAFLKRIAERDAYARALKAGGDYLYELKSA